MIDLVKLRLKAGNGGDGKVSFRREKYIPKGGPDGGKGGDGGDIILRLNPHMSTLQHLSNVQMIEASPGKKGGGRQVTGANGDSKVIEVPTGTVVWLVAENNISQLRREKYGLGWEIKRAEAHMQQYRLPMVGKPPMTEFHPDPLGEPLDEIDISSRSLPALQKHHLPKLIEINEANPEVVIAQGGFGGRGNESFKGSTNVTPLEAEFGSTGEEKMVLLELQLLADVGLIGFPNAGKSTLLSVLTNARPKIANYPFTTLEPQLGVLQLGEREAMVADIPGLIPEAHTGKGLGITFLRHLAHCRILVYVLALTENEVFEGATAADQAQLLASQLAALQTELSAFDDQLLNKKYILCINKIDLYSDQTIAAIKHIFNQKHDNLMFISGYTGAGLDDLKAAISKSL